jgi:hypothetical protein
MPGTDAIITALIQERPLCLPCIQRRTALPSLEDVEAALVRMRGIFAVRREEGRCHSCGEHKAVLSIGPD